MKFNNINQLADQIQKNVDATVKKTCREIYLDSQNNCPTDTGKLRLSGEYDDNSVSYNTEYSDIVEYETNFLRDAYLDNTEDLEEKVTEAVQKAIWKNQR